MSEGLDNWKNASWPIFMPGHSMIGRVATFDSSRVTCPLNPGSTNPAVAWVSNPSRPRLDLPSTRAATSSGSVTVSQVLPSTNSPGCNTKPSDGSTSTSLVRSGWSWAGSITGYLWLSKSRKNLSSRMSTLLGCTMAGSHGSNRTRPASIWAQISRSESSTQRGYRAVRGRVAADPDRRPAIRAATVHALLTRDTRCRALNTS